MIRDQFANIATAEVTMTVADTIAFQGIETGTGITGDRKSAVAMIIDELDYYPHASTVEEMTASGDDVWMGLTISNAVTDITDPGDRRILHTTMLARFDAGTAATAVFWQRPFVYQFFPPIILAERTIYLAMDTSGLASPGGGRIRIYYRTKILNEPEFIELAEVFRMVG